MSMCMAITQQLRRDAVSRTQSGISGFAVRPTICVACKRGHAQDSRRSHLAATKGCACFLVQIRTATNLAPLYLMAHSLSLGDVQGAWVGKTAGGAPFQKGRVSGSWCNNPQYHLTVTRRCEMVVSLMQRDSRVAFGQRLPKNERHLLIGLTVLKVPRDFRGRKWCRRDEELVRETELTASREITLR